MQSYVFMTDSDSDLPYSYVDELDIKMVYMPYVLGGQEYFDDLGRDGKQKDYFDKMRAGEAPITSLLPVAAYLEYIEPCFREGKDILFIAFSSKMSSTIENLRAAREELLAKYPERTDPAYADADSVALLQKVVALLKERGYAPANVDATVIAERPKLAPYIGRIRARLSEALCVPLDAVSVKATTTEGMHDEGKGLCISAMAAATLR